MSKYPMPTMEVSKFIQKAFTTRAGLKAALFMEGYEVPLSTIDTWISRKKISSTFAPLVLALARERHPNLHIRHYLNLPIDPELLEVFD